MTTHQANAALPSEGMVISRDYSHNDFERRMRQMQQCLAEISAVSIEIVRFEGSVEAGDLRCIYRYTPRRQ